MSADKLADYLRQAEAEAGREERIRGAALELYEALKQLRAAIGKAYQGGVVAWDCLPAMDAADAAIAKAEGRA